MHRIVFCDFSNKIPGKLICVHDHSVQVCYDFIASTCAYVTSARPVVYSSETKRNMFIFYLDLQGLHTEFLSRDQTRHLVTPC